MQFIKFLSLKINEILLNFQVLFVVAVKLSNFDRYKRESLLKKDAKPNQDVKFVRYNRELVITVIVITEFDCICFSV